MSEKFYAEMRDVRRVVSAISSFTTWLTMFVSSTLMEMKTKPLLMERAALGMLKGKTLTCYLR